VRRRGSIRPPPKHPTVSLFKIYSPFILSSLLFLKHCSLLIELFSSAIVKLNTMQSAKPKIIYDQSQRERAILISCARSKIAPSLKNLLFSHPTLNTCRRRSELSKKRLAVPRSSPQKKTRKVEVDEDMISS
jgi:hypothetical protein